ncbi:hypothetical protein BSK59_15390, partial [Paenibacillus odorifer]
MAVPATKGSIRTNVKDMEIGDYIICKYFAVSSGAVGVFSEFGTSIATEIPVSGSATPNGSFYLVKVDKGLLVADRVLQVSISWDTLNAGRLIQGVPWDNSIVPAMTSYTAPRGIVSASSEYSGYPAWYAFDRASTSSWISANGQM